MAENKFLDISGLQYFIGKLKTQFLAKGITSISFDNIDNIKNLEDTYEGKPLIYAVIKPKYTTSGNVNTIIGILEIIGDDMSHVVTQRLTTHCAYNANTKQFDFSSHSDNEIYQCFRSYNVNSPLLTNDKGTWTDWTPFVDATIQSTISFLSRKVSELETKFTKLERNAVTLGNDGKIKSSQLPSYLDDVVEFANIVQTANVLEESYNGEGTVVYVSSANKFALLVSSGSSTNKYYLNWPGRDNYADNSSVPLEGKIFVNKYTDRLYRWNGSTLKEVSASEIKVPIISNNEIDNMVN